MTTNPNQSYRKRKSTKGTAKGTHPLSTSGDADFVKSSSEKNFKNFENDENTILTDEELRERSVDEIVRKISKFEQKDIVDRLKELFAIRLRNEFFISEAIKHGVDTDQITVEKCVELLKSSKDGLNQLGSLLRLFSGETTSNSESKVTVEHIEISDRIDQLSRGEYSVN